MEPTIGVINPYELIQKAGRKRRARTKRSRCRGLGRNTCRRRPGCKRASGKKRSFCRRSRNRRS